MSYSPDVLGSAIQQRPVVTVPRLHRGVEEQEVEDPDAGCIGAGLLYWLICQNGEEGRFGPATPPPGGVVA